MRRVWGCIVGGAVLVAGGRAQDVPTPKVSAATKRYHDARFRVTEPTYGLAKVKGLVKGIKPDGEDNERLSQAAYDHLTTPEKFTYAMLHGEDMSQNCDAMPWIVDEEKKLFAYPPPIFGGDAAWSKRQMAFLTGHRTEVVRLLRSTMRAKGQVGANLKATIITLRANELIPDLLAVYNRDHYDGDILSVLMILMNDGKYEPFLKSETHRKLFGPDANYGSYILANEANRKLMAERAMAFYRTRVK